MMMRTCAVNLLLLLVLSASASAQESVKKTVVDGIGIGTSIDEARSILTRIGTGGGRDTRDGGRKEAWTLKETDFGTLALKTNGAGRIVWISAFVRPGKELPFAKFGEVKQATTLTKTQAIWNVGSARGGYRLVAKGGDGKANVVYLLSLAFPEIE